MPQNGKKHIKNHIEKFLEFYKENKVLREVQIENIKAYITRRLRKKEKRTQSPWLRAPNPCHKWIRISLDASEVLDWSGCPKNKIQRPIMQEKWTGSEPTRSTGLYKRYRIQIHSFLLSSLSLLRPFSSQTLTLASQIYPEIAYAWLNQLWIFVDFDL